MLRSRLSQGVRATKMGVRSGRFVGVQGDPPCRIRVAGVVMDANGSAISHLYRRAGFGSTPSQLSAGIAAGYDATVAALLDRSGPDDGADPIRLPDITPGYFGANPSAEQRQQLQAQRYAQIRLLQLWWLDRMVASTRPLREKLTFLWHGHFATSNEKVDSPTMMLLQNQLLRSKGAGTFDQLLQSISTDPAMMVWLDANTNRKGKPNENFSREVMELFSLGIGNYSDADVREGARSFTGWVVDRDAASVTLVRAQADYDTKTLLGQTGLFRAEDVVQLLSRHPATATHIAQRMWSRLAWPVPVDHPAVVGLAKAFGSDLDVSNLIRNVLTSPMFTSSEARTGLIKEPVEWVVGSLRALGLTATGAQTLNPNVLGTLELLGQSLFNPPSVGGWPQNTYWLSTQATLARSRFATALAMRADIGWLDGNPAANWPDVLSLRLGIDHWSAGSMAAIKATAGPRSVLALALTSPEFVLN